MERSSTEKKLVGSDDYISATAADTTTVHLKFLSKAIKHYFTVWSWFGEL